MTDLQLEIRQLGKTYPGRGKGFCALEGMDLQVNAAEIIGILGPNGAGKTTAVKLIMGLIRPTEGDIFFHGNPLGPGRVRRGIGYLPENFCPNPHVTVLEYVTLHCRLAGAGRDAADRASELLAAMGMGDFLNRRIADLSKGMGQRVGLAQAFAGDPGFLVLDEPTSGLDPIGKSDVIEFLLEMKARGKTILFCSHILSEVARLCDRIGIMVRGRLNFVGTPAEFLEKWEVEDLEQAFKREAK